MANVRLRAVELADLPVLFSFQQDPEACRMAAVIARTEASFREVWEKSLSAPRVVPRVILVDERVVGSISCFQQQGVDSVGYWIDRQHWGRGIASAALALLVREVTRRPLHARAARSNAASIRVLERCGFKVVGYEDSPGTERYLACEEAVLRLD